MIDRTDEESALLRKWCGEGCVMTDVDLRAKEAAILRLRANGVRLKTIGEMYGVTCQRIEQIVVRATGKKRKTQRIP